jgi:hypothetical protein
LHHAAYYLHHLLSLFQIGSFGFESRTQHTLLLGGKILVLPLLCISTAICAKMDMAGASDIMIFASDLLADQKVREAGRIFFFTSLFTSSPSSSFPARPPLPFNSKT